MSPFKSVSLPIHSQKSPDYLAKNSTNSLRSRKNSSLTNESKMSIDSDMGTVQEINHPFVLRVVNPDIDEEEDDESIEREYTSTLSSKTSTPENKSSTSENINQEKTSPNIHDKTNTTIKVQSLNSSPLNTSKKTDRKETSKLASIVNNLKVADQGTKPTVIRKESKTLVEQPVYSQSKRKKSFEFLPPLETLPPLFSVHEAHLLTPLTETSETSSPTTSIQQQIPIMSQITTTSPPELPQHHPDFLTKNINTKTTASVMQQPIHAVITNEAVTKSPEEISETDYNHKTEVALENQYSTLQRSISPPPTHQRHSSLTPSLSPSVFSTQMHQQNASNSRYSKASYSLTNNPEALKLYRSMATKTNDPYVQLAYAKYLLEIASLYDGKKQSFKPSLSLALPKLISKERRGSFSSNLSRPESVSSRRSSLDTHVSSNTTMTFNSIRRDSFLTQNTDNEEAAKLKKRKMLEEEGVRWIKRLARENVGEAAYLLASWYDRGMYGFRNNSSKAIKYYEIAANEKIPEAMFAVGQYHEKQQDYMTSFQLYEEAAGLGLVEALYRIAMINLNGEFGSRRNIVAAIQLLMKASEKSTGSCPEAPYVLGLLLLNDYPSINIPSELIQSYGGTFAATTYLGYASEMGMSLAQFRLGHIYENGLFGIRVNLTKAHKFYELAATTNNNGYAMLGLSRIYNQGVKVPPEQVDEQLAIFEQDETNWVKGCARDEDAAFRWCHLAANQNISDACYLLGWYYEIGIGVPRDFEQARRFYAKAMKKGGHKEAADRNKLLETLVKNQKNENKRLQDTIALPAANLIKKNNNRESQCNIM